MPFALIIAGVVLTVAGVRNTEQSLFALLKGDFTGTNSFLYWTLAILLIGALGYVPTTRTLANTFLALVLIVLVIANKGVFDQFTSAIKTPIPPAPVNGTAPAAPTAATAAPASPLSSAMSGLSSLAQGLFQ